MHRADRGQGITPSFDAYSVWNLAICGTYEMMYPASLSRAVHHVRTFFNATIIIITILCFCALNRIISQSVPIIR
jgi:hypothetical protein